MPTRPALDYAIDRDSLDRAAGKTRIPLTAITALASLFTRSSMFPGGQPYAEVSTQLLDSYGVAYSEAQKEAGGYPLFLAAYAVNKDAAVNASRFSQFHLCGSIRSNTGLATAAAFKTAMETSTDRAFQAFIQFNISAGLVALLTAKDWTTWATRYSALNTVQGLPWPSGWVTYASAHLSAYTTP